MEDILKYFPLEQKNEEYISSSPSITVLKERLAELLPSRVPLSFRIVSMTPAFRKHGMLISRAIRNLGYWPNLPEIALEHSHEYIELVFVLRGTMVQVVDGVDMPLKQGQVCILNLNTSHYEKDVGPEDTVIFVGLAASVFKKYCGIAGKNGSNIIPESFWGQNKESLVLSPKQKDRESHENHTFDLLYRICAEMYEKRPGYVYLMQGMMIRLLHDLFRHYTSDLMSSPAAEKSTEICREISNYMRLHLQDVDRETVANTFNFAPGYINVLFKKATGKTFIKYLQDIRLETAEKLLVETDMSVGEIIETVGYTNKNYFYKLFQNKYGVTPSVMRQNSRTGPMS